MASWWLEAESAKGNGCRVYHEGQGSSTGPARESAHSFLGNWG